MTVAAIFMGIAAISLVWLAQELFRHHQYLRAFERDQKRRERMQERVVQANGRPRTGNVSHITYHE